MSKASDWVRTMKGPEPFYLREGPFRAEFMASVTEDGNLRIDRGGREMSPKGALALARWIIDTFGEETK